MIRKALAAAWQYLINRALEASTYRGLILMTTAGGWHRLDGANKGEVIAQAGIFLAGLMQAAMPSEILYRAAPRKAEPAEPPAP
jgi:hypothetical protein